MEDLDSNFPELIYYKKKRNHAHNMLANSFIIRKKETMHTICWSENFILFYFLNFGDGKKYPCF